MARSIHQSGFLLNWQCLGFKQIKYQLMWNSITKTWDFSFMKIENWNSFMPKMCIQVPWTMLCFYLGIELFFTYLSSHFFVDTWNASLSFLLLHRTPLHTPSPEPAGSALRHDFSWLSSSLYILHLTGRMVNATPRLFDLLLSFSWYPCLQLTLLKAKVSGAQGQRDHGGGAYVPREQTSHALWK